LRRTITFINTTANRTSARGITGVNKFYNDPRQRRFVFDKGTQLSECPRVMLSPLAMPNRNSVTNAAQIFQSDTPASVFSLGNNALCNGVIDISSEASFFTRTLYEKSFGCLRALGLKFATEFSLSFSKTVDLITRIRFTIGVGGNIDNTQVNSQVAFRVIGSRFGSIYHDSQVEDTITENQIRLPNLAVNPSLLVSTNPCRDNLSAAQGQYRNFIKPLPRKDTLVINHSRVGIKGVTDFPINLITLRDLSHATYCHLRRKFVMFTEVGVNNVVQMELTVSKSPKRFTRGIITSLIEAFHRLQQSLILLWIRGEFYHQSLLHTYSVEQYVL